MRNYKLAIVATTALVGSLFATGAFAQSTGTNEVEEVVIVATAGQPNIDGVITAETAPKAKASIDQEFISTQASGQTIIQSLNLTPGLNFTNSDPYGSSGGNLRIRGFDGNRISLTFDGIPLNDTGNYAVYTNQQLDPELISRASVNMGTTDVDSPTASATGGTINYISLKPSSEFGGRVVGSLGEFNYGRIFGLIETGEIGPMGTSAWFAGSTQKYDKFKGPGELKKWQLNGKIYQPIGDNGDFVSIAAHYNENRNNFYRSATMATFRTNGFDYDNNADYVPNTPDAGIADVDFADNSNFYGVRINPSNTGNIRAQSKFTFIPDTLTFTLDSAVQYTLANGGGSTVIAENSALVRGDETAKPAGLDLNGDGDILDSVRLYTPNTTNTRRYTTLASLIWNINDSNTVRFAYTYDYGDHRQTGHYGLLNPISGQPQDVFGGKDGNGRKVLNADGYALRTRDRQSFAILNQFSLEYRGKFFDDALQVNLGLRAPTFDRDLNQFCLSQRGSTTVLCTTQATYPGDLDSVTAGVQSNPNVVSLVPAGTGTLYIVPYDRSVSYDAVLPNVGVSWRFAAADRQPLHRRLRHHDQHGDQLGRRAGNQQGLGLRLPLQVGERDLLVGPVVQRVRQPHRLGL
jgi:iron complex outermembrane receptor protein